MRIINIIIISLLLSVSSVSAQTPNLTVGVEYDEPTTNTDGSLLKVLKSTSIYYETRDDGGVVLDQWRVDVPPVVINPVVPYPGGHVIHSGVYQISPESAILFAWASATNSCCESARSEPISIVVPVIDLGTPVPPSGLKITIEISVKLNLLSSKLKAPTGLQVVP